MKIKSTNNLQNRRNIRKKEIGSIVTGALRHRNGASLENLAGHVSRRLNRTMAQIYPAVNRTLNCGVRDGFITKHGNKYSLSSKRNYETDFQHPHPIVRAAMGHSLRKTGIKAFNRCFKRRYGTNCGAYSPGTECRGIDLISLEQCNYAKRRHSHYCDLHERVELLFRYMTLYFENIVHILNMYHNQGIRFRGRMEYMMDLIERLKVDIITTTNAAEIYVRFLKRFARFIRNAEGQLPDNELEYLLRGFQKPRQIRPRFINYFTCFGTDLESGEICLNGTVGQSEHCATHYCLHVLQKLFIHGGEKGDGLHSDTVKRVLISFPLVFTPAEYVELTDPELPMCLQLYMSLAIRLADHAILQYRVGHSPQGFVTAAVETKRINNFTLTRHNCLCKCLGEIPCQRLFEYQKMLLPTKTFNQTRLCPNESIKIFA